jgi:hypothetical protein
VASRRSSSTCRHFMAWCEKQTSWQPWNSSHWPRHVTASNSSKESLGSRWNSFGACSALHGSAKSNVWSGAGYQPVAQGMLSGLQHVILLKVASRNQAMLTCADAKEATGQHLVRFNSVQKQPNQGPRPTLTGLRSRNPSGAEREGATPSNTRAAN